MRLLQRLRVRPDRIEVDELAVVLGRRPRSRSPSSPRSRSRSSFQRRPKSVPWFSISSTFQPPPMPNSTRPPDSWSSVATSLAVVIGSRSMSRQMPVASLIVVVTAAAGHSATNGIVRVPVLLRQLAAGRVRRLAARRDVRVLREPQRLEAALLAGAREVVGADGVVGREDGDAELHASTPLAWSGTHRQSGRRRRPEARGGGADQVWRA